MESSGFFTMPASRVQVETEYLDSLVSSLADLAIPEIEQPTSEYSMKESVKAHRILRDKDIRFRKILPLLQNGRQRGKSIRHMLAPCPHMQSYSWYYTLYKIYLPDEPTVNLLVHNGGFNWHNEAISVLSGGTISKQKKGWGRGNHLSIEDPFEPNRNVASTVTRLPTIRNEFVRAHTIVAQIQQTPEGGWEWRTKEGDVGEPFFLEVKEEVDSVPLSIPQGNVLGDSGIPYGPSHQPRQGLEPRDSSSQIIGKTYSVNKDMDYTPEPHLNFERTTAVIKTEQKTTAALRSSTHIKRNDERQETVSSIYYSLKSQPEPIT
ncbi:hypothetical protein V8E54_001044 [Elaphomyces granulatus]